ncbi:MAG: serine/threonine protein phosphatase [Firmicutes bacterium]|nr:serine/threonine protein phosphatase [Bacillota bacterium]
MKTFLSNIFTKNNIKHSILSAIIYFISFIFSKISFSLISGQELPIANALAPALGIIWGPTAAVGISIASFTGDFLFDSAFYIALTGAIANFFLTYIPYKLWHTVKVRTEDRHFFRDTKSVVKYSYIVLLTSLTVGAFFAMIVESSRIPLTGERFFLLVFYHVDLSFIIGIPALILLSNSKVKAYLPSGEKRKLGSAIYYDILLYMVAFIGMGYIYYSNQNNNEFNPIFAFSIWMLMFLLLTLFMLKPIVFRPIPENQVRDLVKKSIKAKITCGFILVALGFVGIMGAFVYVADFNNLLVEPSVVWNYFYMSMVWLIHFLFVVALIALWRIEKKIIQPLEVLTVAAENFINIDHQEVDSSLLKKVLKIHKSDEIGVLSNAFGVMMKVVDQYVIQLAEEKIESQRRETVVNHAMQQQLPANISLFKGNNQFDIYAKLYQGEKNQNDFYDFFLTREQHLFMYVAEMAEQEDIILSAAKNLITRDAELGYSPNKILNNIKYQLCKKDIKEIFHTVFMGIFELDTGRLRYVYMGDTTSLLYKTDKTIEYLDLKEAGSLDNAEKPLYQELNLTLECGDMLFLATNGFTHILNQKQCLEKVIAACNEENADTSAIIPHIKNEVDTIMDGVKQVDDITMLLLKYY